jgi:Ran GTPase-activating protein (RanGAP) involved in mRNA processing and transport
MELLERLAANDPQLTELDDVPPSVGMRELATALALNTTLTSLSLWGLGLFDADAHELAGMLERNKTLKTLHLYGNNIGSNGARHLAAALERNTTLETLNLTNNNIGSDGARYLAAALERNKTLKTLNLTGNNIGSDGARYLAAALERNCTLTMLSLGGNDIGQAGAAALRTALETNCTLERLDGVNGVDGILKRNRGVRVARKQQVMSSFSSIASSCSCIVLSRCCGSARAEAIQPRALFAGIVSEERLHQLTNTIECWLQSNVKDVVRLIARLLWGTKVGS